MQTIQLNETRFHFFIKSLRALRFSAVWILTGRAMQIFDQNDLRLLVPNTTWFLLGIFKFNLYLSGVTQFLSFFSNISFMNRFKLLSVLYISIQRNFGQCMFRLHLSDFSNSYSYELT